MGVTPGGVTLGTAEKGANFPEVENQRAKNTPKGKNGKRTNGRTRDTAAGGENVTKKLASVSCAQAVTGGFAGV